LWTLVLDAPRRLAAQQGEFIVQMIDEFQFLNAKIYRDKKMKTLIQDLAGSYLNTAESKIAPLLVSGSWVGWLMKDLSSMLPARFKNKFLKPMEEEEAAETVYKYSWFFEVPVTDETAFLLVHQTEGNPFYISAVIRSNYPGKDLTTLEGLSRTLEFETLDDEGSIKLSWMEYIAKAFPQINNRNTKNIVLHLSKHRDREFTRREILEELKLEMSDSQLEIKLKALVKTDIINQGTSNYRYSGVKDNIFDKVFRGVYEEEIREFDAKKVIGEEYTTELKEIKDRHKRELGKYYCRRGYFIEYLILEQLRLHAREKNVLLKSITRNLPVDFNFCVYERVWRYDNSPEYGRSFNVDVFARAIPAEYSIIGEVKYRDNRKFSKEEVVDFERKLAAVKKCENVDKAVGFIYSSCGFTAEAEAYCKEKGIACSEDERWLE
jgi:hypothetical protein